jgi:hypothetical protein
MEGSVWKIENGVLDLTGLHKGQVQMMRSNRQVIGVIAGTQSGKTVSGPPWLLREIISRGEGQYLVVGPSLSLLKKKAMKEFLTLFEEGMQLGKMHKTDLKFTFSKKACMRLFGQYTEGVEVLFGYAQKPESLESMTVKAVWGDEAGQGDFKYDSFLAIQRRCLRYRARQLYTTTPYNLGWFKREIHDRWLAGDPRFDVIRFESKDNPTFPIEEWNHMKRTMPKWKFDLFYRAIFTSPAGAIYDVFNYDAHTCDPFYVPSDWPRVYGVDFGNVNTAMVCIAIDPKTINSPEWPDGPMMYAYRTYRTGNKSEQEHVNAILAKEDKAVKPWPPIAVGGARSEDEWREGFGNVGMPIFRPTIAGVEEGISKVYAALATGRLRIFRHRCQKLIDDEIVLYSRELDKNDEPTDKIANKNNFHRLDALRYAVSEIEVNRSILSSLAPIETWGDGDE